jgi:hypothetical protein
MQLYIYAKSKKAANEALKSGQFLIGERFSMFDGDTRLRSDDWPAGSVVKIYSRKVGGQPYAKAYGTVTRGPHGVRIK